MAMVAEVTYGTTPATPALKAIRHTGTSLGLSKENLQSEELRSDRQITDLRHGARQVGGDIEFELSHGSLDDALQAVLMGTWGTAKDTTTTSISAAVGSFARAAGSFTTDGFAVGDIVTASGFTNAGNNGRFLVTAVVPLTLTVTALGGQTMAVEAAANRRIVQRAAVRAGTTRRSFTIERFFADLTSAQKPYHRFTGCEFNNLELQINANAMVTGKFGVIGRDLALDTAVIAGSTYPAATTTSPFDSFSGSLMEGGTVIGTVTEVQLKLENGLEPRYVVGDKRTAQPSSKRSNLSGNLTVYFENSTMLEKFINETESSVELELVDAANNKYTIYLPRIKYTGGQPDVKGEGPITLSMPFQALMLATAGTQIQIER